jgi:hypothetical protein
LLSSHCAAILLSCAGWLLHCLLSCRLIVLSFLLPSCPLAAFSLRCPLVVSSHRLVVASPLVIPPSHCPLTPPLSCCLALADCCFNSPWATLLSSSRASPLSSCRPLTVLPSHCLIMPAGCCNASRPTALLLSSHWVEHLHQTGMRLRQHFHSVPNPLVCAIAREKVHSHNMHPEAIPHLDKTNEGNKQKLVAKKKEDFWPCNRKGSTTMGGRRHYVISN